MQRLRYLPAVVLSLAVTAACADEPQSAELLRDQEALALEKAEITGLAMFRHDQAASIATDAALSLRAFPTDRRVAGWVTEERDGAIIVTFIDKTPAALYQATVSETGALVGEISALEAPRPLSDFEAGAATARSIALETRFEACSERYNTVVLPADEASHEHWTVYLLPATEGQNVVPIGGTYRVETYGRKVTGKRGFTRSCVALQNEPRAAALMITHLLDPTPTEAHVFWSLWADKPLYVATVSNGTAWSIEGGKIRPVERGKTAP